MADGAAPITQDEAMVAALRLRDDFPRFAKTTLRIKTKSGEIGPFTLNRAQQHIHARLEAQRNEIGRVRAVIVKGRQLGSSTYVQGRFYWRLWRTGRALKAYILTHEDDATANLFGMAQLFQDEHPWPPRLGTANAKELVFADTKAGYKVATAGNKSGGRSSTIQLFHGSEVAYWPNDQEHVAGVIQAVGEAPGTEIILESTANGIGNVFQSYAAAASRGASDYQVIFVPWHWGEDYQRACPNGWTPAQAWLDYAGAHRLTWEQLYWAWRKNEEFARAIGVDLDEPCWKFRQEYPADLDEAFQTSGNSFIPGAHVLRARRITPAVVASGPLVLGIDASRVRDKVGIIDRRGRRAGELICERMDPGGSGTYVAQQLADRIRRLRPKIVNIDVGAEGTIYDLLCDYGLDCVINPVNFGSKPVGRGVSGDRDYANRRAEMYDAAREWLNGELPVQVPDSDSLQADLTAAEWGPGATRYNATNNQLILEAKDAIKARLGYSPDLGDALALTFAVPTDGFGAEAAAFARPRTRRTNKRTGY